MKLAAFLLGTAILVGCSLIASDPLWTPMSSLVAAGAAWPAAPRVFEAWVGRRRLTLPSLAWWYTGAALPFDATQLFYTSTWRLDFAAGNLVASTALLLAVGVVMHAVDDLRRHMLPACGAAGIGVAALLIWSWPR